MSTRTADSRDASPDGEPDSPEKRRSKKRKVLSCYACRNRKMKCDRVYPICGRCQKNGRPDQCTYDPRLLDELQGPGDPSHVNGIAAGANLSGFAHFDHHSNDLASNKSAPNKAVEWKLRVQERRLDALEKKMVARDEENFSIALNPDMHRIRKSLVDHEPESTEQMLFRGKGFKTHFYGSTCPFALITQFRELQSFTREALTENNGMDRVKGDIMAFRNQRKARVKDKGERLYGNDAEILSTVPEKETVDAAVKMYFQTFESTYRILHEPSFWKEYHEFWEKRNSEDISITFAVILVLIVASTQCLTTDRETLFVGDSSVDRETATDMIDICDAWLLRRSRKKLTLAFFQTQCLSLLAKRANSIRMKQDWINSGDVMRLAIASGLHRNPLLLGQERVTAFEVEMRRRLWATIMELELQSSIDLGHQSSLCGLFYDTQPPANLPDDAIPTESEQLPAARQLDYFTPTAYLVLSRRSLALRIHLIQLLNNPTTQFEYSDVLHYDKEITSLLGALPAWDDSRSLIAAATLDLQLRQFLLLVHQPYAVRASKDARFTYSFSACINAANSILTVHENLLSKGILALNHTRSDTIRTGIILAQGVYHNSYFPTTHTEPALDHHASSISSFPPSIEPQSSTEPTSRQNDVTIGPPLRIPQLAPHDLLARTLITTGIDLLERARAIFERKAIRLGTGYMEYWILSVAIGIMPVTSSLNSSFIPAPSSREDIASRGRKALERITNLCFRVLAMQKDPSGELITSLRSTTSTALSSDVRSMAGSAVSNTLLGSPSVSDYSHGHGNQQLYTPSTEELTGTLDSGTNRSRLGDGVYRGVQGGSQQQPGVGGAAPWDNLLDMQVDVSDWGFPDLWGFNTGGDF